MYSESFYFFTTERKTWEVKRYVPLIADKLVMPQEKIIKAFELFPIVSFQDAFFEDQIEHASNLIGERDSTDSDLLALTMKLKYPL